MKLWNPAVGGSTILGALMFAGPASCAKDAKDDAAKHDHAKHGHAKHGHAKHGHSGHSATSDHSGAAPTTAPAARNYADAIRQFRMRMASLDAILKSGDYDGVHKDSVAIAKLGDSLGALAAAPGSPVPRDRVKDVTTAGTELAAAARSFHSAAHDEDLATVKADYARMGTLIDSLARHVAGS